MSKYLLIGALGLALALSGLTGWALVARANMKADLERVQANLDTMKIQHDLAKEAQLAEKVRADREKAERIATQRATEALLTGDFENADTPFDPRLIAYFECLRTAGTATSDCAGHLTGDTNPLPDLGTESD